MVGSTHGSVMGCLSVAVGCTGRTVVVEATGYAGVCLEVDATVSPYVEGSAR